MRWYFVLIIVVLSIIAGVVLDKYVIAKMGSKPAPVSTPAPATTDTKA